MRYLFAAAFALATATAASAQPVQAPLDSRTHELSRLVGTWTCQGSTPGNTSVQVYAPAADGSLSFENRVHASTGRVGVVLETFRFDPRSASWTLTAGANAFFGGLHLRGPAWTEPVWVLGGTEIVNDQPRPVRIVYTDLGALGFRRAHQVQSGQVWENDAELTCRREAALQALAPSTSPAATPSSAKPSSAARSTTAVPVASAALAAPTAAATPAASPRPAATPAPSPRPVAAPTASPRPAATPAPSPRQAAVAVASVAPRIATTPQPVAPSPSVAPSVRRDVAWKFTPPEPTVTPVPPVRDRAYDLVGSWACETIARDPGTHTYSLASDGSLRLLNRLRLGTQTFSINEVYRYDSGRRRWTNDTEQGAYRGSAPRWVSDDWTFEGLATERGKSFAVRMLYKMLGTDAFRRDFQKQAGSAWTTYASETCSRSTPRTP